MKAMKMTICCKEINDYLEYCEKNPDLICEEQKLLIENIVKPTLNRNDIFFDEIKYKNCIKFCELWFYKFFPYQKFVTAFIFMFVDDVPLFRTIFVLMGRGNGKDGWWIPICLFMTTEYYGVDHYDIDLIANSENQIKDTYKIAYDMLEENKDKMKKHFYWNKEEIINIKTKSRMKWWTSSAKSSDGKKPGLVLYNEYHMYEKLNVENTNSSGLGKKRHAREIIITSNGLVRDGALDRRLIVYRDILKTGNNVIKAFPFINRLDSKKEVEDKNKWVKSNPSLNYMPTLKTEIEDAYNELNLFPTKKNEFYAKRMGLSEERENEKITSPENVMYACFSDVKNRIPRKLPENITGKKAIIGLDFASFNDIATVGFTIKNGSEYIWRFKGFICKRNPNFKSLHFPFEENYGLPGYMDYEIIDEDFINEDIIVSQILIWISEFNVIKIVLDNYKFMLLRKAFIKAGISVEDKNNKNGLIRIIRYPASVAAIVAPKLEMLLLAKRLNFGDSALMRWAISNTYVKDKKDGNKYFEKVEPKLRKNDPFMAFVCTLTVLDMLDEEETQIYSYF